MSKSKLNVGAMSDELSAVAAFARRPASTAMHHNPPIPYAVDLARLSPVTGDTVIQSQSDTARAQVEEEQLVPYGLSNSRV